VGAHLTRTATARHPAQCWELVRPELGTSELAGGEAADRGAISVIPDLIRS
jgi:hypothetical protein